MKQLSKGKKSLAAKQAEMRERNLVGRRSRQVEVAPETFSVQHVAFLMRCTRDLVIRLIQGGKIQGYQKCKMGKWYVLAWSANSYIEKLEANLPNFRDRHITPEEQLAYLKYPGFATLRAAGLTVREAIERLNPPTETSAK